MEARTLAKIKQRESDELAKAVDDFLAKGGVIQVLPAVHHNRVLAPDVPSAFDVHKKHKAQLQKKIKKAIKKDDIDELDDSVDITPSRETPTEQLDIEVE